MLRLLSPLGELHALPLVCETSTASIGRICSVLEIWYARKTLLVLLLEVCKHLLSQLLAVSSTDHSISDQLLLVLLRWRRHALNLLVHDWLREAGLVNLVMTVVAISDHVKHDVLPILGPVFNGESAGLDNGHRV